MIYGYDDLFTILLVVVGAIIVSVAQAMISSNYRKYKNIRTSKRMSGQEVARMILDANGLEDVHVVKTKGELTDHYDPTRKVVRLSTDIFDGETIAAISVAAHECGHAIQDKVGYMPMRIRAMLVPIVNFISYLGYFGLIVSIFAGITGYIKLSILILLATVVFQLVTLPVEFDASNRAKKELVKLNLADSNEEVGVANMLRAAAMTYVAGLISNILQLLRLFILLNDRDN